MIHPTAIVDSSAKIASGARIGPYCVVGPDVVIGEDTELPEGETYTPVVIRQKEFPAERLTIDEAVDQMELVGHDFFLFVERETGHPSVVYRRKGWNYGVISLTEN